MFLITLLNFMYTYAYISFFICPTHHAKFTPVKLRTHVLSLRSTHKSRLVVLIDRQSESTKAFARVSQATVGDLSTRCRHLNTTRLSTAVRRDLESAEMAVVFVGLIFRNVGHTNIWLSWTKPRRCHCSHDPTAHYVLDLSCTSVTQPLRLPRRMHSHTFIEMWTTSMEHQLTAPASEIAFL